jgi:hypothetical protein
VHQVPAGDFVQDRPAQHRLRDRSGGDAEFHGVEAGRGAGDPRRGRSEGGRGEQPDEAARKQDETVEERNRVVGVAGGAQGFEQEAASGGLRLDAVGLRPHDLGAGA